MPGAAADLFQVFPGLGRKGLVMKRQGVQPDDGVHGRADLMAHAGQEGRFRFAGLLRLEQRGGQRLALGHGFTHLFINFRHAHPHCVHDVVIPVFGAPHTRDAEHFIIFPAVPFGQIAIGDDRMIRQGGADVIRFGKLQKAFPIAFGYDIISVPGDALPVGEAQALGGELLIPPIRPVAGAFVPIQIHVIHRPVIGRHGGNHVVGLGLGMGHVFPEVIP